MYQISLKRLIALNADKSNKHSLFRAEAVIYTIYFETTKIILIYQNIYHRGQKMIEILSVTKEQLTMINEINILQLVFMQSSVSYTSKRRNFRITNLRFTAKIN